jgi:type VI secretion system secreted protein Hcp
MSSVFAKFDPDIAGQSTAKGFEKQVTIENFSTSASNTPVNNTANGNRTSGKPSLGTISVSRQSDSASPMIQQGCTNGTPYKTVTITTCRTDNSGALTAAYVVALTDAFITYYAQSVGPDGVPFETFSLDYAAITNTFNAQKADGTKAGAIVTSYDSSTAAKGGS